MVVYGAEAPLWRRSFSIAVLQLLFPMRLACNLSALLLNMAAGMCERVARFPRAVELVLRELAWQDRILKGSATLKGHTNLVHSCAFSPDGKRIVTSSHDETARLWDTETGAPLATLEGHTFVAKSCAFSPNGKRILTASYDATARLWDAETGVPLATLEGHAGVIFSCASPDGTRVVTTSHDKTARLWNVAL